MKWRGAVRISVNQIDISWIVQDRPYIYIDRNTTKEIKTQILRLKSQMTASQRHSLQYIALLY